MKLGKLNCREETNTPADTHFLGDKALVTVTMLRDTIRGTQHRTATNLSSILAFVFNFLKYFIILLEEKWDHNFHRGIYLQHSYTDHFNVYMFY
jgi:hypothetical protein